MQRFTALKKKKSPDLGIGNKATQNKVQTSKKILNFSLQRFRKQMQREQSYNKITNRVFPERILQF
jgi:hypothetical protein